MLVLALDTTTRQGSVALARDGVVIDAFAGDAAVTHAQRLPGDLIRVLDAAGVRVSDVELFGVASGPGSFTGLRIGIASMQALALANGKPLAGVSALDALYEAVSYQPSALNSALSPQPSALGDEVAVWMDAQRGQVFSAVYVDKDVREAALVETPAHVLARWGHEGIHPKRFAGDGAIAYRQLIHAAMPEAVIVEPLPPLAPSVARLAEIHVRRVGPSSPDAIRPIYVRRADVELARDKAALGKR